MTRGQELWALALAIEQKHGSEGPRIIAEKIGAFAVAGETGAVDLWHAVAERYETLLSNPTPS